jgi:dihydrodipicolinate synthase/N-acetylneuraminate lyase
MTNRTHLPSEISSILKSGTVIPAHPLALDERLNLDEKRQRALTRYYLAAGSGGLAIGVHTTQFEIHNPEIGLYRPVLELCMETIKEQPRPVVAVAGICGRTEQATREAQMARDLSYHAGLLSMAAFQKATDEEMLEHVKVVAEILPIFGFYLQPLAGGRILSFNFWRRFAEIENVVAIKIAPFNRYQTIDVVRAVAASGRNDIALYTGNDDAIVYDLTSTFTFCGKSLRIVGGLLGHWAFWTKSAVELLNRIHVECKPGANIPAEIISLGLQITDSNAAVFDAANGYRGCIPGIHEILRRQGFLRGLWCLNPRERLSPGQIEEIDRVYQEYPHLNDDMFVREHLDEWMR